MDPCTKKLSRKKKLSGTHPLFIIQIEENHIFT